MMRSMPPSCDAVLNPGTGYDASIRYSYARALHALEKSVNAAGRPGRRPGTVFPLPHKDAHAEFGRAASYLLESSCTIPPRMVAMPGERQGRPGAVPAPTSDTLRIDAAVEDKARRDSAYGEFTAAVASACASEAAGSLGITGYWLDEKKDPESPGWLMMVLRVDFAGGDFDSKRERRIRLRKLLNERIRRARLASCSPEGIDEIAGRFFITVSW